MIKLSKSILLEIELLTENLFDPYTYKIATKALSASHARIVEDGSQTNNRRSSCFLLFFSRRDDLILDRCMCTLFSYLSTLSWDLQLPYSGVLHDNQSHFYFSTFKICKYFLVNLVGHAHLCIFKISYKIQASFFRIRT